MLVLPMALIAAYSFMEQGNSIISFSFTLEHYAKFFTDQDFLLILWRSLVIAVKTTIICFFPGLSGSLFYCPQQGKNTEHFNLMCDDPDVDQHAGPDLCLDRALE